MLDISDIYIMIPNSTNEREGHTIRKAENHCGFRVINLKLEEACWYQDEE